MFLKMFRAVRQRLQSCLRANDTLARLGGQDFCTTDDTQMIARRILAAVPNLLNSLSLVVMENCHGE